jgi:hypothetical protein
MSDLAQAALEAADTQLAPLLLRLDHPDEELAARVLSDALLAGIRLGVAEALARAIEAGYPVGPLQFRTATEP